ncbi:adenosylcobinamide-phosphate synthase CbiB [Novosphingobium fluoreni]|uniref:adenosylcobinamide-phosphate synthase CbiB n=1 Tax=Novosphingobium fluoreni TaxID=1391222 RepID=UPI003DA1C351
MVEPVALVALAIDAVVGWPAGLYRRIGHPVGLFARIIDRCEQRWNRADTSPGLRRALGVVTVVLLLMVAAGGGLLLQMALGKLHLGWIGMALLAWPALAQRSLYDHVVPVAQALERSDLNAARQAVGAIVGRDTAALDRRGVARAAIESLAESFCDGIVAPLFWLLVGGLPGIWAYKAINTADSMIGHREERWRAFGWAAARLDDALNLVPARIAALLLCLGGGGGWRILWRDARKHASPNAGWTEAAMAGALGLRLAGPIAYDGVVHHKDWIGSGRADATAQDLRQALAIYRRACLMLWIIAAVFAVFWGSIAP